MKKFLISNCFGTKKAIITGIFGQDGAYLAKLLLGKGYLVYGTGRDTRFSNMVNLERLGIADQVELESMNITDFLSVVQTITKIKPDELYNLAGQSSVGLSFEQPVETLESFIFEVNSICQCGVK